MKKILCFSFLIIIILSLFSRCIKIVDSYKTFYIQDFDTFFEDLSSEEDREEYLRKGKLELAKLGNVYLCPFMKESSHEECIVQLYVYSLDEEYQVTVTDVKITNSDNTDLTVKPYKDVDLNELAEWEQVTDTMLMKRFNLGLVEMNENWFFDDNTFEIKVDVAINTGTDIINKTLTYPVEIRGNKRPLAPT